MAEDLIRYDLLAQDALRGVVRKVLADAAVSGLPGEHHFFVAFETRAPGVRISNRLRERYPEEMTVVLQHQFWGLEVTDNGFSVSLSFNGVPEKLVVPFSAIKGFVDPSVQFRLLFEPMMEEAETEDGEAPAPTPESVVGEFEPAAPGEAGEEAPASAAEESGEAAEDEEDVDRTAEVVSLDAFRKKS